MTLSGIPGTATARSRGRGERARAALLGFFAWLAPAVLALGQAACTRDNPAFDPFHLDSGGPTELGLFDGQLSSGDGLEPDWGNVGQAMAVDLLLVVDNSSGMGAFQQLLAQEIGTLVLALESMPGGVDFRLGVVTTDMGTGQYSSGNCSSGGDHGRLFLRPICPKPQGGVRYLEKNAQGTNVSVSAQQMAACMVQVGTPGCGFEQPLEAMRAALSGANPGFLRPGAALAVLVLSNEDDCSARSQGLYDPGDPSLGPYASYRCFQFGVVCQEGNPPFAETTLHQCQPGQSWLHEVRSRYISLLKGLKPPGWLSVLVIAGPTRDVVEVRKHSPGSNQMEVRPSCTRGSLEGDPGFRLRQFADGFGSRGSLASVCEKNYQQALQGLASTILAWP